MTSAAFRPWHSVDGGDAETATANIRAFVKEAAPGASVIRCARQDYDASMGDGRFAFILKYNDLQCEIQMPGLPLGRVRFLGTDGQNAWGFPRLYVDGNSWLWCFAVMQAREALGIHEEQNDASKSSRQEVAPKTTVVSKDDDRPVPQAWDGLPFLSFSLDEPLSTEADLVCEAGPHAESFRARYLVVESPPHEWEVVDIRVGIRSQLAGGSGDRGVWAFTASSAVAINLDTCKFGERVTLVVRKLAHWKTEGFRAKLYGTMGREG